MELEMKVHNPKKWLYFSLATISSLYTLSGLGACIGEFHWAINGLVMYLILVNSIAFYKSSTMEPGFLPVRTLPTFDLQPIFLKNGVSIIPDILNNSRKISFEETTESTTSYIQNYCLSCNVFKSLRTSHCINCGYCVLEKDHHCIWLDNCIGRNNYTQFFCFIWTLAGLSSYVSIFLHYLEKSISTPLLQKLVLGVKCLYFAFAGLITVYGMYQTFLSIFNLTSREFVNSRGKVLLQLDFSGIIRRFMTLRPKIIQYKNVV